MLFKFIGIFLQFVNAMQRILLCFICVFVVTACSPVVSQRGNFLQDYQLSDVKPQTHTRSDVLRLLGSPTAQSTFNPDIWYYIGQETEKRGILDDRVKNERIVVVAFNEQGVVQVVEDVDADRLDVPYAKGKTPTHGNELTFMQQLLGNLGRFNAPQGSATDTASSGRI